MVQSGVRLVSSRPALPNMRLKPAGALGGRIAVPRRPAFRVWLYCFLAMGLLSAIARYDLWVNRAESKFEMVLVWPGWFATVFLGGLHDELRHGWDYLVVFLLSGMIWGTLLFTFVAVTRVFARKPAA